MLLTAVSALGSALLVVLSRRHWAGLSELRRSTHERIDGFVRRSAARSPTEPRDARALMAELNETTLELGNRLREPALVPKSCAKVAFLLGACIAMLQAAASMGTASSSWVEPLLSLASGLVGAVICSAIGRSAELEARGLREDWNALIRRFTRDVAS